MRRILVVEDDEILNDVYRTILSTEPYEIETAYNGEEALDLCKEREYDLILLDLMMPNVDGLEFLERFKPEIHPKTKIIVTSNLSTGDMLSKAIKLGAHNSVIKADISPKQLIGLVRYEVEAN